jgi:hypothetical protein
MNAADLYDCLAILPGAEIFLLSGGDIYGVEGLAGLRLIAQALYESVQSEDHAAHQKSDSEVQHSPHLVEAEAILTQSRGGEGLDHIACFHFEGEPGWHLRWSAGWTHFEAVQELVEVIRHGLILDECGE